MRIVDPLCDANWDQLVLSHPNHNFFHRAAWAKVLWKTYGHEPFYIRSCRERGPVTLIPLMEVASPFTGRRGVSLPFSDFCCPLSPDGWGQESLLETLLELGRQRKWRYFELRGGREMVPSSATVAETYYGHTLDLTIGIEKLFACLESPVRRAIRKSERSGLAIEASTSREAMLDFYQLHVRTRRRHGLPPQPVKFFLNIQEEIAKADLGFVMLAKSGIKPAAASVFLHSGTTALYKYGASDERLQTFRGNNLVMWEGIKQLVGKGLKTLDFGRTSLNNDGLRRFKLSWGTKEEMLEYFRFDLKPNMWVNSRRNASELHNQLFRRLPLAVNRVAGALIYPHLD